MRAISFPILCLLLTVVLAALTGDAEEPADRLTFDQLFEHDRPGEWPKQLAWSPDGTRLGYLLPDGEGVGQALWALEVEGGEAKVLFRAATLAGDGEAPPEIDAYRFAPAGGAVLIEIGGDLRLVEDSGGEARVLASGVENAAFSPDGGGVAYVRDADLHLLDLGSGRERRLTRDGRPGEILNGKTDWVYGEEIWNREPEGFWWSPDGGRIAFYRFDDREVERYPLVDFMPRYPEVEWQRYPKAGGVNPRVRVGVVELAGGEVTWLETGGEPDDYLARVDWLPGGGKVAVQRLNRDQTLLELMLCDPADGRCSRLLVEEEPTWVNLSRDLTFLADGRFLWSSERNGIRQIFLYGADGELIRQVSRGNLSVTSLDGLDEGEGWVYFTAHSPFGVGANHREVHRASLDGSGGGALTGGRAWNQVLVASGGKHRLHSVGTADVPTRHEVVTADGRRLPLPTGPEPPYDPAALPPWEFLTLWSLDASGRLPARMLKPAGFDPERRYPAIMYHYGCPGTQVVADRWDPRGRDLWHKMMAQRGYVVLLVDNQTSTFFGKRGEDRAHRDFGTFDLMAQLAGVEYLKTQPYVDPERIGLWGWSGGGSTTLAALFARPGVWRAGVAGAPVTDWRLYDTIWTERYLDHPDDNPEGYEASSPVTHAARLADPLLVVHGTADDNVHPQNTLVLARALIEAGKPFEQAVYPRQKHAFRGKAERHLYERMTEFFDRHLRP